MIRVARHIHFLCVLLLSEITMENFEFQYFYELNNWKYDNKAITKSSCFQCISIDSVFLWKMFKYFINIYLSWIQPKGILCIMVNDKQSHRIIYSINTSFNGKRIFYVNCVRESIEWLNIWMQTRIRTIYNLLKYKPNK